MGVNKKWLLQGLLAVTACGACLVQDLPSALAQAPAAAAAPASPAAVARTRKIVAAANAFLGSLSDDQRKTVLFAFNDAKQRVRWSNFPGDFAKRTGVRWGELNETQRAALTDLLGSILSPKGMKMIKEQMDADDIVKITPATSPIGRKPPELKPGGPDPHFGSDYFYVSFVGTPSLTSPWMLQYGAHHLGLNATVVGPHVTLSPTLTGGEPLKYVNKDGKPVYIVEDEATKGQAMLNGLTPEQRSKAIISSKLIDLVLGPGHDGQMLQPEGLPASEMTAAQKAQFLGLIEARVGILNADTFAETMAVIRKNLNQTYFGWWGPTDEVGAGYFRVTGPTVVIEFAPQEIDARFPVRTQHGHNMYRDPTNEYGAAWTSLK